MPEITAQEYENKIKELKEKVTSKFLETLSECAKLAGYEVEHTEILYFIEWIYSKSNISIPEKGLADKLDPYEIEYLGFRTTDLTKEN
jgi:hypothetical protein